MKIQENVSLAPYSTMRLGGNASYLVEITNENELLEALEYAASNNLTVHVVGSGSNSIFSQNGFDGLVIVNRILGITETLKPDSLELEIGAGEEWDNVVALSVGKGFIDIAALSLIPGTVGAAPVQNIGAYGQQISDSLISLRAHDTHTEDFITIDHAECGFSYRHSRFNTSDKGRFIVTSVKLRLHLKTISPPFYADVARYFEEHGVDEKQVTPAELRKAVSTVRVIKLPDPSMVANCGSFFKNPVVSAEEFEKLQRQFPELKSHQTDDGKLKLYGAQLIELAGLKDYHDNETGMATWKNQALVLVNESAKSTDDLLRFKERVVTAVEEKFGITLQQEPEFIEKLVH